MNRSAWERAKSLLAEAAELPASAREQFVLDRCPDPAMRREVLELLASPAALSDIVSAGALEPGAHFGAYVVERLLGRGGMGEVYRARDANLARDVAIKVLPPVFTADRERLARFAHEARVLASLNHPYIGAIYGVEEANGMQALVLELIEGETLADRLARGAISAAEALPIARQIVEALEAAHEQGVVHRDLKPANIKITPAGTVKVLDFGLAKVLASDGTPRPADASTQGDARAGFVVGTPAYMSPEQARGEPVSRRTDVWAFGIVLFEMLTGRHPFGGGGSATEVVAGILHATPDWGALPAATPAPVARLLRRCLEKDSRSRLRDIGDARIEIDDARSGASVAPLVAQPRQRRVPWTWLVGGTVAGALLSAAAIEMIRPVSLDLPGAHLSLLLPPGKDFSADGVFAQVAVAPDGRRIAFPGENSGRFEVLVRDVSSTATTTLAPGSAPFFSGDGRGIGFVAGGRLMKLAAGGEAPQEICRAAADGRVDWTSADTVYFGEQTDSPTHGIRKCPSAGGEASDVSVLDRSAGETHHGSPQLLPDGRTLLFTVTVKTAAGTGYKLAVQSAAGGPHRVVLEDAAWGRYVGNGLVIYQRGDSLFATHLDPRSLTIPNGGALVLEHVDQNNVPLPSWDYAGGVLAYRPAEEKDLRLPVWVSPDGTEAPVAGIAPGTYRGPQVSRDGGKIAFWTLDGLKTDVVIYDVRRQQIDRLTRDGLSRNPAWLAEGRELVVQRQEGADVSRLVIVDAETGAEGRVLRRGTGRLAGYAVTQDRKTLLYGQFRPELGTGYDLLTAPLDPQVSGQPFAAGKGLEAGGRLAPREHWVLFAASEDRRNAIRAMPFPAGGPRRLIAADAREGLWSANGREIYFRRDDQVWMVPVASLDSLEIGQPRVLFERPYHREGGSGNIQYDVAPDGRFLMMKDLPRAQAHFNIVQNWDAQVRRILERH